MHREDTLRTKGDAQFTGEIERCSVHRADIIIYVRDFIVHRGVFTASGGYSLHLEDIMSALGDI